LFFVELFMGLTKLMYSRKTGDDHLDSQTDVFSISGTILFRIYKVFFPLILFIGLIDDFIWSKIMPGHMIIVKAIKKST
jgi:hypothetical protein